MLGRFFDTSVVDAFSASVAADLAKLLPPALCEAESKAALKGRQAAHERISRHAEALAAASRLNIYQKAKLGVRLQAALETAGYPTPFAKAFAYDVVSQVATRSSQPR